MVLAVLSNMIVIFSRTNATRPHNGDVPREFPTEGGVSYKQTSEDWGQETGEACLSELWLHWALVSPPLW
jgi:hypothetical protein